MKKLLFMIAIAIYVLPVIVLAHPGKTDANGGHWNHKTGEYHYHHGYPEHQHDPDCPYDYKDKTGQNSGSSSSTKSSSTSNSASTPVVSTQVKKKSGPNVGAVVGITCVGGAMLAAVKKK